MKLSSAAQDFTTAVLSNQGLTATPLSAPYTCDNCRKKIAAAQFVVTWHARSRNICADCAIFYLKSGGLLFRVEQLNPSFGYGDGALLKMLQSSTLGRLAAITVCSVFLIPHNAQQQPGLYEITLNKSLLGVFAGLIKSIVYPSKDIQGGLVRLLASKTLCDLVEAHPSLSQAIGQLLRGGQGEQIRDALKALPGFGWHNAEKITRLADAPALEDHDPGATDAANLQKPAPHIIAKPGDAAKYKPQIDRLTASCSAEAIRAMHNFIFRFVPGGSVTTKRSVLVFETVMATYGESSIESFYHALPDATRKLVDLLTWRRSPLDCKEIESKLGLRTTAVKKVHAWRNEYYVEIEPEYRGFLGIAILEQNRAGVLIIEWLAEQFKKILPKPEGATLTGSDTLPQSSGAELLSYNPDFVALLPNIYQQLQQKTLPLKINKMPTIAGYRTLAACGGDYQEFYPNDKALRSLRSELLYRMFSQSKIPADSPVTPQLIVKRLLDALFEPQPPVREDLPDIIDFAGKSIVAILLTHLDWQYFMAGRGLEKTYLDSIRYLMSTLPKNRWFTIGEALDYLYFNNKGLSSPAIAQMTRAIVEDSWGSKVYSQINAGTVNHYWEEPLLKTFVLLLASIGAMEVLYDKPVSVGTCAYNQLYLTRADGVFAFRLSPLGEWYFQGGDESCFKQLERGRIVLDQKRLLLQVQGNDIALKAVLAQAITPVGENFYSVDSGSFLKECRNEEAVVKKINAFKALLPDELPEVWQRFFETTLARLNPLQPVQTAYTILQLNDAPELKQLLLSDRKLRQLTTLAEGGLLLISQKNMRAFKKSLADLGFFVSGF
ncbi:MAG: hypothetical protein PHO37_05625 [Kiritimatiellae bacterium]|nr:hypothetical protein [Kiritimatiellia bacterium]